MELTKDLLKTIPLKKLLQTYTLLSNEIPVLKEAAYLDVLEIFMENMGEEAVVTGGSIDGNSHIIISSSALKAGELSDLAMFVQRARTLHGFGVSLTVINPDPDADDSVYEVRIDYLPPELSWVWNTVTTEPIHLKTIVKKLKRV